MNKFLALIAVLCLALSAMPSLSFADEAQDKQVMKAANDEIEARMKAAAEERQESAKITYNKVTTMMLELPERQKQHFFMAYTNYNLIETVKTVQKDVGAAIDKCGENNPEMKKDLNTRFTAWNDAVAPMVKESEGQFKNMLLAQDYASDKELKDIFDSVDHTRAKTYDQIEKIPVTTPEACRYLLSKMDETQESMTNILRATLVNFPNVSQRLDERAKAKAEAKARYKKKSKAAME